MNFSISKNNSCSGRIFDGIFSPAFFPCNSSNASRQIIPLKDLNIFDFKGFKVNIFKSQQSQTISDFKSTHKSFNKVSSFLNRAFVLSFFTSLNKVYSDFNSFESCVHSYLQLHVLHNGTNDLFPMVSQRCHSMRGYWNFAEFESNSLFNFFKFRKDRVKVHLYFYLGQRN